jgi:ATP/maltotriose-dependent transcriptional regulator MalT
MNKRASPAKISRPRLFDVVPRERLFALLDENRGRPLLWIAAPPGAGKTALVASYLEARATASIWYQVDPGDADPAMLFHYLSQAAQAIREVEGPPLPRFVPEHLADLSAFARLFFRSLYDQLPPGAVLVLDNYQEAPEGAPLHEIIEQCVAETPPEHTVICISRQEAPGPFVRFAASRAMMVVDWDCLRLTLDEVKEVSAQRGVTDGRLTQALYQQSQGWAAGVTLMLERIGHLDGTSAELPSESCESVFNYFASLIFDRAPELTRHVLLSVAFLPQVTPSLAVSLSEYSEAAMILDDLYRRRLFVDRRRGVDPQYQFHALFLDFLRARARQSLASEKLDHLLWRCASALEALGDLDAAMDLWAELDSWEHAIALILRAAPDLINRGRRKTLERWLGLIGKCGNSASPWLTYWHGCAQLQTEPETGTRTLEQALQCFRQETDRRGQILCLATLLAGGYIGYSGMAAMDRWIDELLEQADTFRDALSLDDRLRVWGVLCCAVIYVRPWHPLATSAVRHVEELLPASADASLALTSAIGAISC